MFSIWRLKFLFIVAFDVQWLQDREHLGHDIHIFI